MKHVVIQNQHIHAHIGNSNVRGGKLSTTAIDVSALERDLRSSIQGEVRFSDGDRALYATDASNYRQVPIGIVIPKDEHDVIQTIALCRSHDHIALGST